MKKFQAFKITLPSERMLRTFACIALATISAIALGFAGSPKDGSAIGSQPDGAVTPTPTPTPCVVCHKNTQTLVLACNSLEFRRHKDHGDPDGPCPSQGARREN